MATKKELKDAVRKKQDSNFEKFYNPKIGFLQVYDYNKYQEQKEILDFFSDIIDSIPEPCNHTVEKKKKK